ncbi:hypothetical protein V8E54_009981 [Elaphomyces granulatus]|jgi:hypothetical protein
MLFKFSAFLITLLLASICSTSAMSISSVKRQNNQFLSVNLFSGPYSDYQDHFIKTIDFTTPEQNGECIDISNQGASTVAVVGWNAGTKSCEAYSFAADCSGDAIGFFIKGDPPSALGVGGVWMAIKCSWDT